MKISMSVAACALAPMLTFGGSYGVERTVDRGEEAVVLTDKTQDARVVVIPSLGDRAVEFSIHGKNVLFVPPDRERGINGIPFLAPWANRLSEEGYWANGKHYLLNKGLHNYQDSGLPIHGLLTDSKLWEVTEAKADNENAHLTCRLQFWKSPELMAQWPFAQEYEITYRLSNGELEVRTSVKNLSSEPIPVSIGFHPYYQLPGIPRDEWSLTTPIDKAVTTDKRLIPTGEIKPSDLPNPIPMRGHTLDNGFTDLTRDSSGRAHFHLASGSEAIDVTFGPKYQVAVLWEPPANGSFNPQFICIEPMAAVTDGINLQHQGLYNALQSVAPGQVWTESFWIRPSGL